jgi:hypothetical protein
VATNLVVPNEALENLLNNEIPVILHNAVLHLYSNLLTIGTATVVGDFTECTFAGYAAVTIAGWNAVAIDGSNRAYTSPTGTPTFTPTGGGGTGNVYGCYLTDDTGVLLIGATEFAGAPITAATGVSLIVPFTYTRRSEFTSP